MDAARRRSARGRLPVVLITLDRVVFNGYPFVRGSMSAYYYSGMREFFAAAIFGSGAFLLAYKVSEVSLDNTASIGAGFCAWLIAMCPTGRPSLAEHPKPPRPPLNPLQDLIGEKAGSRGSTTAHRPASSSASRVVTVLFGYREGQLPRVPQKLPPRFWRRLPLHVRSRHGPGRRLDPHHIADPQRPPLVDAAGRMGLHLGVGALLASERRGVGHPLR